MPLRATGKELEFFYGLARLTQMKPKFCALNIKRIMKAEFAAKRFRHAQDIYRKNEVCFYGVISPTAKIATKQKFPCLTVVQ
jgi:hypothetical protein